MISTKYESHDILSNDINFTYVFFWKTKKIVEYVMTFIFFLNHGC